MKIIVDAMGGDNAPDEIVRGAVNAAARLGVKVRLVGKGEEILRALQKIGMDDLPDGVKIVNATEVIEFDDDPVKAIQEKKDSSMAVGCRLLRDGRGDAFVSAGNTGALLSGATLIVGRVRGIRRAALAPVLPSKTGRFILIDCGANAECTAEYLLQFAFMGSFYAENVLEIKSPRIGLLNNGTESTKGTSLQQEAYALLKNTSLNFIGNIEAKEALQGVCDVLVCDGFTGNAVLKSIEGTASFIMSELKAVYMSGIITKLSALLIKSKMSTLKDKMNPDAIGGTALLGISKPVLKAHGSSNAEAISSAIERAVNEVNCDVASRLRENIDKMKT